MRHEKKLLAIPWPVCPPLEQKEPVKIDRYSTITQTRYCARVHVVEGEEVLEVVTFKTNGEPEYRFWQLADKWGVEVQDNEFVAWKKLREHGKIYGASIASMYPAIDRRWYHTERQEFYALPESADVVLQFLGQPNASRKEAVPLLARRQIEARRSKLEDKKEKQRAKIRESFEGIEPGASVEFEDWCERVPLAEHRYFFYEYTGRKKQSGVCSYCGTRAELEGIRDREYGQCPGCLSRAQFWSAKRLYNSHGITHRSRAALCAIVNGRMVVRKYHIGICLQGGPKGLQKNVWAVETLRCFYDLQTGSELERYEEIAGTTAEVYVDGLKRCVSNWSPEIGVCAVHPAGVEEIRKAKKLYAPLEELAKRGCELDLGTVWGRAERKPEVEYLIKLGLYRVAAEELRGSNLRCLLPGKTVPEKIGVDKEMLQILRGVDPAPRVLMLVRALIKCGVRLKAEEIQQAHDMGLWWNAATTLLRMREHVSIHKALNYIQKQMKMQKTGSERVLQEWNDYMGMAKELGKRTEDLRVVFPKDLKAAHDAAAQMQRLRKNKELNAKVRKTGEWLNGLCWTWNGLSIRPARSHEEMFQEGETLSHCVGRMGYAEKMAERRTAIFFIRKKGTPEVPYVTLELDLKKWEKIQCYGKGDTYPGSQVANFVVKWLEDVVKPAAEKGIGKKAGTKERRTA